MKKIIALLITGIILAITIAPAISYAQAPQSPHSEKLFQIENGESLKSVKSLQTAADVGEDFPKFYAGITKILLGVATVLVVVGFFVSGVMYVSAQGDDETLKKAKNIALYTILGIIIIAVAYGITIGIARLNLL